MGNQSEFWKHLKQLGVFDVFNPNLVILNRIIESGNKNFKKFIVNYNKSMEIDENNLFGGTEVLTKKEIIDQLKKTILDEKERQIISNLEELYRDFEQRRQDGAVEVDGRISKEEQAGEPKPPEEKVSGGLTELEKSNLEAIGKEAGINFQEVRNVYNKYGEGKPLSEITLEDYQRAEEKRGKGKEAAKESVQEEIDNLFNVYESIEDSKGMEKRGAAEEFRNMQESIKSPTLKRIFDNIKDIHSQLEKQGLITKTKGCP
jgi:transcriptional regulator of heat shock response